MSEPGDFNRPETPLRGARIWLSGAVPDDADASLRDAILTFVGRFCDKVFHDGGSIVHGSHPTLREVILQRARVFHQQGGTRERLTLVYSHWFLMHAASAPPRPDDWRQDALVYETPIAPAADTQGARDSSLLLMRQWIAAHCDAVVAVGGRWWDSNPDRAGVPVEFELTRDRGLPCFLLGGFGGAAAGYLETHPELLTRLKNGLDRAENLRIATEQDIPALVDLVGNQLGRLPLVRGQAIGGPSFRILALDGGGIKGTFTAAVLAQLEELTGQRIAQHFDLIAGTSTGGILAIGLGLGITPLEMLEFYRSQGPVIFPLTGFGHRLWYQLRHLYQPKFSQEVLLRTLRGAYPVGARLGDSNNRLVIPACMASNGRAYLFRTPHHRLLKANATQEAAEVALATAAAPTYFAAAQVRGPVAATQCVDGGVWANDPALAAMVEAVRWLSVPLDRIEVLSIGTTASPFSARRQARAGIFGWGTKALGLLMDAQGNGANLLATALARDVRMLRIDETLAPGAAGIDKIAAIPLLAEAGAEAASNPARLAQVQARFLNGIHVEDWRPTVAGLP